MPELIPLMVSIRNVFNKYAAKDGDPGSLSKAELAELLRNELMGDSANKATLDGFFADLDDNGDGVVDFQEFVVLVTALTVLISK